MKAGGWWKSPTASDRPLSTAARTPDLVLPAWRSIAHGRHPGFMTNAHTDSALNGMKERLANEFADRPRAGVAACFDNVTKDLLAEARILDFVPLLAYRLARGCVARLPAEESQVA